MEFAAAAGTLRTDRLLALAFPFLAFSFSFAAIVDLRRRCCCRGWSIGGCSGGFIWPRFFITIFIPPNGLIIVVVVVRPLIVPIVHVIIVIISSHVVFFSASHEATVASGLVCDGCFALAETLLECNHLLPFGEVPIKLEAKFLDDLWIHIALRPKEIGVADLIHSKAAILTSFFFQSFPFLTVAQEIGTCSRTVGEELVQSNPCSVLIVKVVDGKELVDQAFGSGGIAWCQLRTSRGVHSGINGRKANCFNSLVGAFDQGSVMNFLTDYGQRVTKRPCSSA